ncbi:Uncharacterised protein [Slackia heliotrinireducens]|uniref:CpXC domain-containing protein n=1 Tax=Slackia heliotrinireducens (strain ATCC 29202 / DSM 20476 / NCTC 11029 / RHS 1) TaxID=471855 RepID=C7N3B9_SLAHD|nr:CpXC domain-containing protein [Slackia heliotrinireducens]ACV23642.1 hypothetical protein Shel_26400 [Slackia heliotrinireducens DSM 20476]VEH03152.1 Uncharacterised protein [Slackia heliotrinireducens]
MAQAKTIQPRSIQVKCPSCSHPGSVEVWPIITSTTDERAMELVLNGRLFEHVCPACGKKVAVAYDCLLHDVEHRAFLLYTTKENPEVTGPHRLMDARDALRAKSQNVDNYQLRLALTTFEFCEKVRIWHDGYDDRAIELMKVAIKRGMLKEGIIGARDVLIYERTIEENGGVSFVVVGEIPGDVVGVPQGYDYCKRIIDEADKGFDLVGEYRFGAAWANAYLP